MSDCIEIRVQLLVTCVRVPVFSPPHADESRCTPDYSRDNIREQITNFPAALITHFCKKPRLGAHNHGVCTHRLIRSKLCSPFARLITLLLSGAHRSSSRSSRVEGHRGERWYECKTEFTVPQTRRADNQELDPLQFRIVHRFQLVSDP